MIKFFLFIFVFLAFFLNLLWLVGGLGFGGVLFVLLVNIIALRLIVVFFVKKKSIIVTPVDEKKKVKRIFVFAGISAVCLSSLFFFYSWNLIVGHELTSVHGSPYRFYYDFIDFLLSAFGPYFAAFVNMLVGIGFIFGGFKFITKKIN